MDEFHKLTTYVKAHKTGTRGSNLQSLVPLPSFIPSFHFISFHSSFIILTQPTHGKFSHDHLHIHYGLSNVSSIHDLHATPAYTTKQDY